MAKPKTDNPPDTGKDEEELGTDIVDDTEQVPDMGQGEELSKEAAEEGEPSEAPDTGQAEEGEASQKLQEFMKKKGLKNLDEVAKVLADSEKRQTELEQERRLSSLLPQQIPPRQKIEREARPYPKLEKDPIDMSKEEYQKMREQERGAFKDEIRNEYLDAEDEKEYRRTYARATKVINKDPEKFERLKPTMNNLRFQYPNATFEQLYDAADGMEGQVEKERKETISRDLGLSQGDLDTLKVLAGKARPARISGAGATGGELMTAQGKTQIKKLKDDIFGPQSSVVRD